MKYREVRKLYRKAGWRIIRQKGSHEQWEKDGETPFRAWNAVFIGLPAQEASGHGERRPLKGAA